MQIDTIDLAAAIRLCLVLSESVRHVEVSSATKGIRMESANSPTRRQFIVIGGVALPLLVVSSRSSAATNASMRNALKYQDTPSSNKDCAGCAQFIPGKTATGPGGCKLMPGDTEISPRGYCTAWTAKST
jgi:hypothetical protein